MDSAVLALICEKIAGVLRGGLCPGVIGSGDAVGVCTPADKGDFTLGVNLVDVQPAADIPVGAATALGTGAMEFPSSFADAYIMVTSYSSADVKYRATEDNNIIGHVFRVLADTPVLTVIADGEALEVPLVMPQTAFDHKIKLWVYPDMPYRLSLLYKAGPILVRSGCVSGVSRVWGGMAGG